MFVSGQGLRLIDPADWTAIGINEGIITTGDDATGLFTMGSNATSYNSGSVSIGDLDLGEFIPNPAFPTFTDTLLSQAGYGVAAWGESLAQVVNYGEIATGDGTVGAAARMYYAGYGYAAQLLQNTDGVIVTGDDSTGALVAGNYSAALINEGRITVGDDSTGVDMSAGSVVLRRYDPAATVVEGSLFGSNSGIVETGDNSVGVRMNAVLEDVAYEGIGLEFNPPGCSPYYPPCDYSLVTVSGTADSIGTAYLVNAGTIRTGAGSTAVEITGAGAADVGGVQIFNTGTIQAGVDGTGTAIRINVGNDLDSYVVNVGSIGGSIVFGDGDDLLINTQFVDSTGRVTSTGDITLNGTTIDFGGGANRFDIDRGTLTLTGGNSLISGADVAMTLASIDAINGVAGSTLTIDGNLSGGFTFGTDLSAAGADRLVVLGDVAAGSEMGFVLNPTEQLSGAVDITVMSVEGQNGAAAPTVSGVSASSPTACSVRRRASTQRAATSSSTRASAWATWPSRPAPPRPWRRTGGCSRSRASTSATCTGSPAPTTAASPCGAPPSTRKAPSSRTTGCRTRASTRRSRASRPASRLDPRTGRRQRRRRPVFGYGDANANPNANVASARAMYGLRPQREHGPTRASYFDASS